MVVRRPGCNRAVAELADYERRFRRAGLPLFIEDYSAREDVWTRAAPLLVLVAFGELLGAIQLDWPVVVNIAAWVGGLGILIGAFGLLNLARKRPFLSLPENVGAAELAAFVLVPAALPLIFGGQWGSALVTAGANLVVLAVAYGLIRYGVLSILRWTGPRLIDQLDASVSVLSRAVPLLLVFALVLFINTEMWQVFSTMPRAFLAGESVVIRLNLFGEEIEVTEALLRVSGGIAAFAGLYYAIAVLTDATYRQEFRDELIEEMAGSFSARAEYLRLRASHVE